MSDAPVCDVCGKPSTVHIMHAEGSASSEWSSKSAITRSENYCAECAVAKGLAEEGFSRPEVAIPKMAEQFARILSVRFPKSILDSMDRVKSDLPDEVLLAMKRIRESPPYYTDFSPPSLWEIDRFYDDHCDKGIVKPDTPFARKFERRLSDVGFYIGEVARRYLGGQWLAPDDITPESVINCSVRFPDGTECFPVQQATLRFKLGAEASIAAWGLALGLPVDPRPEPPAHQ